MSNYHHYFTLAGPCPRRAWERICRILWKITDDLAHKSLHQLWALQDGVKQLQEQLGPSSSATWGKRWLREQGAGGFQEPSATWTHDLLEQEIHSAVKLRSAQMETFKRHLQDLSGLNYRRWNLEDLCLIEDGGPGSTRGFSKVRGFFRLHTLVPEIEVEALCNEIYLWQIPCYHETIAAKPSNPENHSLLSRSEPVPWRIKLLLPSQEWGCSWNCHTLSTTEDVNEGNEMLDTALGFEDALYTCGNFYVHDR